MSTAPVALSVQNPDPAQRHQVEVDKKNENVRVKESVSVCEGMRRLLIQMVVLATSCIGCVKNCSCIYKTFC